MAAMFVSRRALLLAAAALPLPAWAGGGGRAARRGLLDEPGDLGRIAVFRRDQPGGPGLSPAAVKAFVTNAPPSTVGLVAGWGLRVMPASARTPASISRALAVQLAPAKVLVLEGQFLAPTLDEVLRALLAVEAVPAAELADDTWARLHGGEALTSDVLLPRARSLAIQAVQSRDERALRELGMAQLGAWHLTPPPGFVETTSPG